MEDKDLHTLSLLIKANTDIAIIAEALTRLSRELYELTTTYSNEAHKEATSRRN